MKTDRELWELAAKALGWTLADTDKGTKNALWKWPDGSLHPRELWNPLTDDGDCARMESACGIDIAWYMDEIVTSSVKGRHPCGELVSDHNGDKNAARRLASTRAAAQIGEGMK